MYSTFYKSKTAIRVSWLGTDSGFKYYLYQSFQNNLSRQKFRKARRKGARRHEGVRKRLSIVFPRVWPSRSEKQKEFWYKNVKSAFALLFS